MSSTVRRLDPVIDQNMIALHTSTGQYANPFYPLLPPYLGQLLCINAVQARRWLWLGALLSAGIVGAVAFAVEVEGFAWLAFAAAMLDQAIRRLVFPTQYVRVSATQYTSRDWYLALEFAAHMLSLAVASWMLGTRATEGWQLVSILLAMLCALAGVVPLLNTWNHGASWTSRSGR